MPLENKILKDYRTMFRLLKSGETFVAFDTETTGLSCKTDRIIELGAVKFCKDGFISSFNTLINPEMPIPFESSKINHITDEMVKDKPLAKDILPSFCAFIKDSILVGHNIQFDIRFLQAELERYEMDKNENTIIDTLGFARWVFPDLKKYNQPFLAEMLNISITEAHRAYDDAKICGNIFLELIKNSASKQKI